MTFLSLACREAGSVPTSWVVSLAGAAWLALGVSAAFTTLESEGKIEGDIIAPA